MSVSSTENVTPRVANPTDATAITVFPTLTLLSTIVSSIELTTTPTVVPGI